MLHPLPTRLFSMFMLVSIGAAMSGCSLAPAPRLRDATVTAGPRTPEGQVLLINVTADNPGRRPLPLREVDYSLAIDGREVFRGRRSAQATIRRFGSQQIQLPAVIPADAMPAGLPTGEVSYRVNGEVTYIRPGALSQTLFDAELIQPSVTLDTSGKIGI
jgi:LEA14-like dessication related protein